jgi:uncharacterized membrane protein
MDSRPKIQLTPTKLDNWLEVLGKIVLLLMWILVIYVFTRLPNTIPIHFDGYGKANNYGSKLILLILPILATIIFFGLTWLNKYPHIFNYATKITEANAQAQYRIATRMLRFLKLSILIVFSLIILFVYLTTIGVTKGLGVWFLPFTMSLLLVPTIVSISAAVNKKNN